MTMSADRRASASPAARFAALYVAMLGAHNIADYWAQTTHQATNKGRHGNVHENAAGHRACLAHVAIYTLGGTITVCTVNKILSLDTTWRNILTGQLISAASHYFADRRHTLRTLAHRTGRGQFYDSDGGPLLDQSWHTTWLAISALATATVPSSS
ncbi:MAG: hypothetical protein QOI10_3901 [Solirubrobacterales bacterium]|jgi:hypothetical protein|nr:hypothetical protein [Solirubrobacterales bacterium]